MHQSPSPREIIVQTADRIAALLNGVTFERFRDDPALQSAIDEPLQLYIEAFELEYVWLLDGVERRVRRVLKNVVDPNDPDWRIKRDWDLIATQVPEVRAQIATLESQPPRAIETPEMRRAAAILNDILEELRIAGIAAPGWEYLRFRTAEQASIGLPILARWIDELGFDAVGGPLLRLFESRFARPWVDRFVDWWLANGDGGYRSFLMQHITAEFRDQHALRLIQLCRDYPCFAWRAELVKKLTKSRSAGESAIALVVEECHAALPYRDLTIYVKIKDARVQAAIQARKGPPPIPYIGRGWESHPGFPAPETPLWTTTVPVDGFARQWPEIMHRGRLWDASIFPPWPLPLSEQPSSAEVGRWYKAHLMCREKKRVKLWACYRNEDQLELKLTSPDMDAETAAEWIREAESTLGEIEKISRTTPIAAQDPTQTPRRARIRAMWKRTEECPDRLTEVWSTEIDAAAWDGTWAEVAQRAALLTNHKPVPPPLTAAPSEQQLETWSDAPWFVTPLGQAAVLWARYEDVDTIELAILSRD
ncbi:MAG: hypothetical protein JNK87_06705 [Bryobacterales bacterium]|nr:hypothetical protein [Bryobacterales bacterium]